ncbi:hypothetical protein [Hyalangium rubrum]|uniref:Uncharacterized protein n=1 Tax=Hyalangium rubrum TaxID=3103134 RepID=A0ABU5H9S6_9BACT|nr:hypothetical protein [Hyalangium sp. s54d21]MDY7229996.1 hypothetical protein [Hyalangium sp. s54d21]
MLQTRELSAGNTPNLHTMTLDQVRDTILQCLMRGPAGHYEIGEIYDHMVLYRRAVNEGYRTTREYFRQHVRVLSHATLVRFRAVSRTFSREVCEKYGMASLGALLEYWRVAVVPENRREPGDTPIQIPRRGGLTMTKPFADCTMEDLRQAILGERDRRSRTPQERYAQAFQRYCDTLRQYLAENTQNPVKLYARTDRRGWSARLLLRDIRVEDMEQLTQALQRGLKPSPRAIE